MPNTSDNKSAARAERRWCAWTDSSMEVDPTEASHSINEAHEYQLFRILNANDLHIPGVEEAVAAPVLAAGLLFAALFTVWNPADFLDVIVDRFKKKKEYTERALTLGGRHTLACADFTGHRLAALLGWQGEFLPQFCLEMAITGQPGRQQLTPTYLAHILDGGPGEIWKQRMLTLTGRDLPAQCIKLVVAVRTIETRTRRVNGDRSVNGERPAVSCLTIVRDANGQPLQELADKATMDAAKARLFANETQEELAAAAAMNTGDEVRFPVIDRQVNATVVLLPILKYDPKNERPVQEIEISAIVKDGAGYHRREICIMHVQIYAKRTGPRYPAVPNVDEPDLEAIVEPAQWLLEGDVLDDYVGPFEEDREGDDINQPVPKGDVDDDWEVEDVFEPVPQQAPVDFRYTEFEPIAPVDQLFEGVLDLDYIED